MYTLSNLLYDVGQDLSYEYMHMQCYLHFAATVTGLHRCELREYYLEEAASEMKHVTEFADKLVGLGGTPSTEIKPFDTNRTNPADQLAFILQMEAERVETYAERMKLCEELGGSDGATMHVFYENQADDSRKTVDHVRQMLKGI